MWRHGNSRHKKWLEISEEENKVRRSLSKLFHTVQNIPSTRSGLVVDSLWDLVDELESFDPASSVKSMKFTQTTENKSYSKRYLNLRLHPSNEKPNHANSGCNRNYNLLRTVSTERQKLDLVADTRLNKIPKADPQKCYSNAPVKHREKNVGQNPKNSRGRIPKNKNQPSVSGGQNFLPANTKPVSPKGTQTEFVRRKSKTSVPPDVAESSVKKNFRRSKSILKKRETNTIQLENSNVQKLSEQKNVKVLKPVKKIKSNSHKRNGSLDSKLKSKSVMQSLICNQDLSATDESSMVKTLTNYWNNLLKNDESTLEVDNSQLQYIHSFDQLSEGDCQRVKCFQTSKSNRSSRLRHLSDSNINIMKGLENLNSLSLKKHQSKGTQITDEDPIRQVSGDVLNHDVRCSKNHDTSCSFSTKSAVQVLEQLIKQLRTSPDDELLTSATCVPQSVKTMLCLMTTAMMSAHEHNTFDNSNCTPTIPKEIFTDNAALSVNLSKSNSRTSFSPVEDNLEKGMESALALPGISLEKVKEAVIVFNFLKDKLWIKFLEFNDRNEKNTFLHGDEISSQNFTFIYEEEILIEDDDKSELEVEEITAGEIWHTIFLSILNCVKDITNVLINRIIIQRPHAIEEWITMIYQSLVSILVWWVIMKEVFGK
ncbi:hypothetical protein J6590_023198 [Homalodisca vitripennis]|nr:hypothetical protein J6590_023198 [Homalodisca vitripennis]